GNKKYPAESDFSRFIGERGGHYNAFTTHDRTVYGFAVNHEGFDGALDRLSHFFKTPNFFQDTIVREMNAVHHEFEDQIENEAVRVWRVIKETGNPKHPNAVFSCGNLKSLSSVKSADIKQWFNRYYRPAAMHLVVLSPYSMGDMCNMVVDAFSDIPEKEGSSSNFKGTITLESQQGHFIHLKSTYNSRSLQMMWEVPLELVESDALSAMELAHMAIVHNGTDSLLSFMKSKELISDLLVDYWRVEKDHVLFLVELALTKKGVQRVDEVIHNTFQVLNKLKKEGIPKHLFDELYLNEKMSKTYVTPLDAYDFVVDCVSNLVDSGIESYPNGSLISSKYSPDAYHKFFDSLTPNTSIFFLVAPEKESGIKPSKVEKWMGTQYLVRKIEEDKLKRWASADPHPEVQISPANVTNEDMEDEFNIEEDLERAISVYKTETTSIHLATNVNVTEPGIGAWFCFASPYTLVNVKNSSLASIFVYYIQEKLNEYMPDHIKNTLFWTLYPSEKGICLMLDIKSDNIEEPLVEFFTSFSHIPIDEELFEKIKVEFIDTYKGDPEPIELAQITAESVLMSNQFVFSDLFAYFPLLKVEDLSEFVSTVFTNMNVQGVFYGDISEQDTLGYWKTIEGCFEKNAFTIDYSEEMLSHLQQFSWDGPKIIEKATHRRGNALVMVLNVGALQRENWAAQKIVSQLIQEEFFEELRTKQQTAYRLYSWGDVFQDKLLHFFAIQSSTHNPQDLMNRTECFLEDFANSFHVKISKERVNLVRYMLISALRKHKTSGASHEEMRYLNASIEKLKSIPFEEVQKFVQKAFSSANRKRVSVLIEGASES
ncbi:MAG: hypothetical protein FJZ57_04310, partial [Chlamydiae bacterium]|nr:hypothetical protein [Chlamydiota bacterium]